MDAIHIKPRAIYQMFINSGKLDMVECGKKALEIIYDPCFEIKTKDLASPKFKLSC